MPIKKSGKYEGMLFINTVYDAVSVDNRFIVFATSFDMKCPKPSKKYQFDRKKPYLSLKRYVRFLTKKTGLSPRKMKVCHWMSKYITDEQKERLEVKFANH